MNRPGCERRLLDSPAGSSTQHDRATRLLTRLKPSLDIGDVEADIAPEPQLAHLADRSRLTPHLYGNDVAAPMMIAGVQANDQDVLDLARLLCDAGFQDTAEALIVALEAEQELVALSMEDRDAILGTLIDPPLGLVALRDVLFAQYEWRVRVGL